MTVLHPRSTRVEYLTGPVAPADRLMVFYPTGTQAPKAGKRPLAFWFHGFSGTVMNAMSYPHQSMIGYLCEVGFVVVAADWLDPTVSTGAGSGVASWGTSTLTARAEATRVWAAANLANVDASKVTCFGESMGTCSVLAYGRDYPSRFAAGVTNLSFSDMAWCRAHRSDPAWPVNALLAPSIDSAWGLSPSDPTPADADFLTSPKIVGLPVSMYYKSDDTTAPPSQVAAVATYMGGPARAVNVGPGKTVHDATTTAGSSVIGSVTGAPALTDIGAGVAGTAAPFFASVTGVDVDAKTWRIGRSGVPVGVLTCSSTLSGQTLTVGTGHDEIGWNLIDTDEMLSWLLPYALN